jgi:glycyl-tRNA synthetase
LEDQTVTLRDRDTMQQIRVGIDELERIIEERVRF